MNKYSVIIIGAGCLGASVFRALKREGIQNILVLDKGGVAEGTSFHSGGMIRVFHEKIEDQVAARNSIETFYQLEKEIGLRIKKTGALSILSNKKTWGFNRQKFHILEYKDLCRRFQSFHFSKDEFGIYEENGASISVSEYTKKLFQFYKRKDDFILENMPVKKIEKKSNKYFEVETEKETFKAERVFVTAGTGLRKLIPDLYIQNKVQEKRIKTVRVETSFKQVMPNFFDYKNIFYGTKNFQGKAGVFKVGLKSNSENTLQNVNKYAEKRFNFSYSIREESYPINDLYLENRSGISCEIPNQKGLYALAGWGGGAFKFSPYLGQKIVDQALGKAVIGGRYEFVI